MSLGFCFWDIPAALVVIGVVVYFIQKHRKLKKEVKTYKEYEEQSL